MDEYKWFKDDFQNDMNKTSSDGYVSGEDTKGYSEEFESEPEREAFSENNDDFVFDSAETPSFYNTNIKHKKPKKRVSVFVLVASVAVTAFITAVAGVYVPKFYSDIKEEIVRYKNTQNSQAVNSSEETNTPGAKIVAQATVDSNGNEALTTPEIVDMVGPAVVGISCKSPASYYGYYGYGSQQESSGSGVIISQDGYIVTNNHVVENANEVTVILNTSETYAASIVGTDPKTDLAVLKIDASELPFAQMGHSSELRVGDTAIAIGNPLGQEFAGTTTQGIISGLNRSITIDNKQLNLIQTDAAINPGNSGGALVNAYGHLIGINTAKISSSSLEGLGFAIPIDEAKPIITDLIDNGYVKGRPIIGIGGRAVTEEDAKAYGLKVGVYVSSMTADSPAQMAGVKIGDIIVECQGEKVKTVEDINEIKNKLQPGDKLEIKVYRQGKYKNITLILGEEIPDIE